MDNDIYISTDKDKLDIQYIHAFLSNSYWAKGRTIDQVRKSIEHSECYGVYKGTSQIGFARVLTDKVVFAYIMDVFIADAHRGQGYASKLMSAILEDPETGSVSKWYLRTRDAHKLYTGFGFTPLEKPEMSMEKIREK